MILVGQYDSPYVRRVAISLRVLGFDYTHDTRSIFGDFDALRTINPTGRIPALVLDDGYVIVDSAAMLDWIDQTVGPERALVPASGPARRDVMRRMALATGAIDKCGAANYETTMRPPAYRWPEWSARCIAQGSGAIAALDAEPWPAGAALDQAQITTACMVRYVAMSQPDLLAGRDALLSLSRRLEARPEFVATNFDVYALPAYE